MITLVKNELEGCFAAPDFHPITCANPAPWAIVEMKIEHSYCRNAETSIWKIYIRGEGSMWFRADQCFIDERIEEVEEFLYIKGYKERVNV